ncbi:hypothetical protein [Methylorubrum zatmanii]|uniref:Uncharacterized protein n=1 Tax=Methylorubrum zatmanii TaxID=29429 RepID=A0ABW1WW91_9HYPH|nr:hypothetical protein [Methylorubrum zatmanii]MBD8909688.1 hypothetical protein [Methylorubrum zatmanii]
MVSDPKRLAAEIEAVTERERTRLVAWLAEHQVSVASTVDREVAADALMADFIAPRLAEITAFQSREGLIAFAREIIGYAFDGQDADGADIQALALTHGLLVKEPYDPERHGPSFEVEPGDDWYTLAGPLALPLQPEGERNA